MYAKENMLENIKILIKALLYYKSKPQSSVRIEKEKSCTCRLKAKYVNLTPQKNSQTRDIDVQPLGAFVYLFIMQSDVGSGFYESSGSIGL